MLEKTIVLFYDKAFSIHLIFQLYWLTDLQSRTSFSVYSDIMEKAMSILETFYDFHIHQATERYQEIGAREDTYAKPTDRFADFQQAISCMLKECGFEMPFDPQGKFFEEI